MFGKKYMNNLIISSIFTVAVFILPVSTSYVHASKSDLVTISAEHQQKDHTLVIVQGKGDIVEIDSEFSDILVADPSIIDVSAIQKDKLYIVGLTVGDTNIVALDGSGNVVKRLNIHVRTDHLAIQRIVDELFPTENVEIKTVSDQLYLTGNVSTPSVANRIVGIVGHYAGEMAGGSGSSDEMIVNMLEVDGEQQVMLRVRIIETSRDVVKELGVESRINSADAAGDIVNMGDGGDLGGLLGVNARDGLNRDPYAITNVMFRPGVNGLGFLDFLINMLDDDDLLHVLAEPNLTAISGEQAGFLAGGEFPVPVGRDRDGNIVVEFREFGVSLNFVPTVISADRISLQLNTEVSSLSYENAITLSGVQVPGLNVRRADTTVEMASGGSLMIAGLLRTEVAKGMLGVPGIKNTPILGDLLKSDSFRREETELVVIVTPYLVRPYKDDNQAVKVGTENSSPLIKSFTDNIRRSFGHKVPVDLFSSGSAEIGYVLD